jgi:NAD(P) transhydrogenase subunit alpha
VAVLRETIPGERRVALVPAEIPKVVALGLQVVVESGAGEAAGYPDEAYKAVDGVVLVEDRSRALSEAGLTLGLAPPMPEKVHELPQGSTWIGFLAPATNQGVIDSFVTRGILAFSFNLLPRTSRAQAMDALSSQASLAGYQAVLLGAERLGRALPMMMTAAGTVAPARVLVMGAGVAGLQAIATARRLGAAVTSYDIRPEAAEEVRSLGATFLELPLRAEQGSGGYAAAQSDDFLARQQEMITGAVAQSDLVVTTAAVPGRPAPKLLTRAMVERMKPGAVIVDLAASSGGNTEVTVDAEETDVDGVVVIGAGNLASRVATTASALFARNVVNLLGLLVRDGRVNPDFEDDIVAATCVTGAPRPEGIG